MYATADASAVHPPSLLELFLTLEKLNDGKEQFMEQSNGQNLAGKRVAVLMTDGVEQIE